ncbi:MAG TPA: RagB/SusD family nutrient uptake outer membrane protein [Gemmatimonadales bacterium]|nr:RagB/SusD family nutrient uptake outer membrane protein [Gemmatimonadales bacterium]
MGRLTGLLVAPALSLLLGGCGSLLDTEPVTSLPEQTAISSPAGARTALTGAYASLTSSALYGGDMVVFNDLYADNTLHIGTFTTYADAGLYNLRAENGDVLRIWQYSYVTIDRANRLIEKVPGLTGMDAAEKDDIVGQAHALRALSYHNLVRTYGGVPLVLVPPSTVEEASAVTRATVTEVYDQIVADLLAAEGKVTNTNPNRVTAGTVEALLARVYLYLGDWTNAAAKADAVIGLGYGLATNYSDLFPAIAAPTPEEIFKVYFDIANYQLLGYYYRARGYEGRGELNARPSLVAAYEAGDARFTWSISTSPSMVTKWPTGDGSENIHVIRFAEVLLIKAEALARQNQLAAAVDEYNKLRVRAQLQPHTLGVEVSTQQEVLDAIDHERRVELAFEGDRFPDLVRTGRAVAVMGIDPFRQLWPVPYSEIVVAPGLTQNPGY